MICSECQGTITFDSQVQEVDGKELCPGCFLLLYHPESCLDNQEGVLNQVANPEYKERLRKQIDSSLMGIC